MGIFCLFRTLYQDFCGKGEGFIETDKLNFGAGDRRGGCLINGNGRKDGGIMEERVSCIREKCDELLNLVKSCDRIFLYGAGQRAKVFIDVFRNEDIAIDGLITTNGEGREFCGYRIFSAEEAKMFLQESDGVVPAFVGAAHGEISETLYPSTPRILCFDFWDIYAMQNDGRLLPFLQAWNDKFEKAKPLNDPREWKRILVVRTDMAGDVVLTVPFLRELKRNLPDSEITLVVRTQNCAIVKNCLYVSKVLPYEHPVQAADFAGQVGNIAESEARARKFAETHFKERDYDAVFFPMEAGIGSMTFDEWLLGYLCGARVRIGRQVGNSGGFGTYFRGIAQDYYSLVHVNSLPMHEVQYTLDMLEGCGLRVEDDSLELWLSEEDRKSAAELLRRTGQDEERPIRIALGIAASAPSRTWRAENYRELVRLLYAKYGGRLSFVVMGGEDAVEAGGILYDGLQEEGKGIIDLTGRTSLTQAAACMELCDLYVGSNTGLLHIAAVFHKPSVTVNAALPGISPTHGFSPHRMGAWKVPCTDLVPSAGLDGCRGACVRPFSHCINQITPGRVADAVSRMMESEAFHQTAPGG